MIYFSPCICDGVLSSLAHILNLPSAHRFGLHFFGAGTREHAVRHPLAGVYVTDLDGGYIRYPRGLFIACTSTAWFSDLLLSHI